MSTSDPAFPEVYISGSGQRQDIPGLTKREYCAIKILSAMCTSNSNGVFSDKDATYIVPNAIALADYLFKELEK